MFLINLIEINIMDLDRYINAKGCSLTYLYFKSHQVYNLKEEREK